MRFSRERCRQSSGSRGQSTTIGFVLVIAIVMGGTTVILAAGSGTLADTQQDLGVERAEKSLAQVDSKAAMVGLGQSSAQEVSLATTQRGEYRVDETAGNINVTLFQGGGGSTVLLDQNMGELRYESGRTTVAYQGGGVWRETGDGSTMVSPPEFHYRGLTLTLPVVRLDGQGSVSDSVTVSQNETAIEKFPVAGTDNPLDDDRVRVKVQSDYYQAWGTFFEKRTEGNATVYHSNNTAVLDLVTPAPDQPEPVGAVVSGATGDKVVLDNDACMDAYNSDNSPSHGGSPDARQNCDNNSPNGTVYASGGIKLSSENTRVRGNVTLGGNLSIPDNNGNAVKGYVKCAEGNHECENPGVNEAGEVEGEILDVNTAVPNPSPVGDLVDDKINGFETSNDNSDESDIVQSSGEWHLKRNQDTTVESGNYYVDKFKRDNVGNERVVLDTTSGDINIAIDGAFVMDGNTIEVKGPNKVRLYVAEGGASSEMDFTGGKVITVDSSGNRTFNGTKFWVYGPDGFDADLDYGSRESEYTGVIYAPEGSGSSSATVTMSNSIVHGAIVAHVDGMDTNAAIHYDEALGDTSTQRAASPADPRITNIHLTVNRINATG